MRYLAVCIVYIVVMLNVCLLSHGKDTAPRVALDKVQVGGEMGRRMEITIHNNLLKIDLDNHFLQPFRDKNKNGGYIGLGKLIDSMVRLGVYSHDPELLKKKDYVVHETIKTQEPDGYIGLFSPASRMWKLWDIHEMAYLVNGLLSNYLYFGHTPSLDASKKLMDYIIEKWSANPEGLNRINITVFMGVTGIEESLLMLYQETGEQRYLDFCVNFRKLPEWDDELTLGRWGPIQGHAYAYFQRCLSQLRLYQIQPDPALLRKTHETMQFLTKQDGLLINGVCSQHECFHDTQDGGPGLGETCSTAYLIRVLDELIQLEKKPSYGDIMERSILNGLYAAQSPDGRRLRYYVPFESPRTYFDGDTYCCPCNYRRIVADIASMIYYPMEDGLAINLFTQSQAEMALPDGTPVTLTQETDYPSSGTIVLTVSPSESKRFPLRIRIPAWCTNATYSINKHETHHAQSGSFAVINRTWEKGDIVTIEFPMPIRLIQGRKAQSGRVAVMRGPQVFCLNPTLNPSVQGKELREIVIDPDTATGPFPDNTVRPNGIACKIKGWSEMGFTTGGNHSLELHLTEFPDPDGVFTYFRIRQLGQVGIPDELID